MTLLGALTRFPERAVRHQHRSLLGRSWALSDPFPEESRMSSPVPRRARILVALASAALLGLPVAIAAGTGQASAAAGCQVTYAVTTQWNTGFGATVSVTNLGDPLASWTLRWAFPGSQHVDSGWNGTFSQTGNQVTVLNAPYNAALGTGASVLPGFNGSWSGSNPAPTAFTLNGVACTGGTAPPTSAPPTTPAPTTPARTTPPTTPPPSTQPPTPGGHVDNPFAGATAYLNPDYTSRVSDTATATGGTVGAAMLRVAGQPTAVWMDRIAAIAGGAANGNRRSLAGHLDAALAQRSGTTPITIDIVVYDLPNRDCAALASNGELKVSQNGLARYKSEYIDPMSAVFADPRYRDVRIVAIVEPDSLPNLVTNLGNPKCAEAQSSGAYVQGIQYALSKFSQLPNVYSYLDIAHSGWLGWDTNLTPAAQLITSVVRGATPSGNLGVVDGFISNTANYTPVQEPFLPDPDLQVGGQPLKSARFYEFNPRFDEAHFTAAMYSAFVANGFPASTGMLIDTSRDGWGGAARPTGATGSTVDTYVNSGRIDRRLHRGNWCNQSGAGIGARPQASPLPGSHLDAYVWIKPPGESDGTSDSSQTTPDPEGKLFDPMCDPGHTGSGGTLTGALPNSPSAGSWFPAEFRMLVENAFPAV
jgi:cellulose 1,4-beta-cellobiosidase